MYRKIFARIHVIIGGLEKSMMESDAVGIQIKSKCIPTSLLLPSPHSPLPSFPSSPLFFDVHLRYSRVGKEIISFEERPFLPPLFIDGELWFVPFLSFPPPFFLFLLLLLPFPLSFFLAFFLPFYNIHFFILVNV
jgi:hypothetical protein